jgi:hypothetical protein
LEWCQNPRRHDDLQIPVSRGVFPSPIKIASCLGAAAYVTRVNPTNISRNPASHLAEKDELVLGITVFQRFFEPVELLCD